MIRMQFPGKLFVIGEYAAVESGYQSVIAAISRYIHTEIEASEKLEITSSHGILNEDSLKAPSSNMEFVRQAVLIAQEVTSINLPFKLTITTTLETPTQKYGFGSSGVVVVAVIASILKYYNYQYSNEMLFKMAVLVQMRMKNLGSGGDIASSIYGGLISYRRYDKEWLEEHFNDDDILIKKWPLLEIKELNKDSINLIVGWTKVANSTSPYVGKFEALKSSDRLTYNKFLQKSKEIVSNFVDGNESRNYDLMAQSIRDYRSWMVELQEVLDIDIETKPLTRLIESASSLAYPAKISGSGGGDCGIVCNVWNDYENIEKLKELWEKHDIVMLDIEVV